MGTRDSDELSEHSVCCLPEPMFTLDHFVNCDEGEDLGLATYLKAVVGVSEDMYPVKYVCSGKASSLCQSNFMEIMRLSQC